MKTLPSDAHRKPHGERADKSSATDPFMLSLHTLLDTTGPKLDCLFDILLERAAWQERQRVANHVLAAADKWHHETKVAEFLIGLSEEIRAFGLTLSRNRITDTVGTKFPTPS